MKHPVPRSLVLTGPRLFLSWDKQLIRDNLNCLSAERSRVVVTAQDYSIIDKNGPWIQEPWFKTEFMVERLGSHLLTAVSVFKSASLYLP